MVHYDAIVLPSMNNALPQTAEDKGVHTLLLGNESLNRFEEVTVMQSNILSVNIQYIPIVSQMHPVFLVGECEWVPLIEAVF